MKISLNWLKEYIQTEADAKTICTTLTNIGLEVEGADAFSTQEVDLDNFSIGEVLSCEKHPNADRLKVTSVDVGEAEPLAIVCGAPNVKVGMKVAVARIGAELIDDKGETFKIKKSKIRDVHSFGMLCSEVELKLGKDNSGILDLDPDLKVGTKLSEVYPVYKDTIIEIGLTPNRMDAMSHYGVARDLQAALSHKEIDSKLLENSFITLKNPKKDNKLNVEVKEESLVERYMCIAIKGIKVKESPAWLQNKLKAIGISPKNNVVDITNYAMYALGQPLHAFDISKVENQNIVVRKAKKGEKIKFLDEKSVELESDDLLIADANKPLCLAGVMGGFDAGVSTNTTSILLEAAVFDAKSVRRSSKRHLAHSDSSFRFERGVDPNFTATAFEYAVKLLLDLAEGEVDSAVFDYYPVKKSAVSINFDLKYFKSLIGIDISKQTTIEILTKLGFGITEQDKDLLKLQAPTYRMDVTRAADVAEEVLRIYGYDKVALPTKMSFSIAKEDQTQAKYVLQEKISYQLNGFGFSEAINSSLVSAQFNSGYNEEAKAVSLLNPLSQDLSEMRQSLIPGLLENVSYNTKRQQTKVALYEWGKVYDAASEKQMLSLVFNQQKQKHWLANQDSNPFYELKSIAEAIFAQYNFTYTQSDFTSHWCENGLVFSIKKQEIAKLGIVAKEVMQLHQMKKNEAAVLEIDFDTFFNATKKIKTTYKALPKFPFVTRDLSLILDESISFEEIRKTAKEAGGKYLKEVSLFDVYQGDKIESGKKSYAVSFVIQNQEATLSDADIDKAMQKLMHALTNKLGAEVRG